MSEPNIDLVNNKNEKTSRTIAILPDHIHDQQGYQNSPWTAQSEDHKQGLDLHLLLLSNLQQVWQQWIPALESETITFGNSYHCGL